MPGDHPAQDILKPLPLAGLVPNTDGGRQGTKRQAAQTGGMGFADAMATALDSIRGNALRALLTTLGVVIGVAAVIVVVSIGSGAREEIVSQIRSLGSNLIVIDARSSLWLTQDDAESFATEIPGAAGSTDPAWWRAGGAGAVYWPTSLNGIDTHFLEARDWRVAEGRNIGEDESRAGAKVVLMGATVARLLFADVNPVGETIRLKGVPFTVIGVLTPKGQSNTGRDQDDIVFVPLKTAQTRLLPPNPINPRRVDSVLIKVTEGWDLKQVEKGIRTVLTHNARLAREVNDTISIKNIEDVLEIKDNSARSLALLVSIIASVSLIVGGIGIMNIMLVSVVERTREIGIRMAVGARQRDIMLQFLAEAVMLSVIGGAIGTVLGIVIAAIVTALAGWPFLLSWQAIVIAISFSAAVGILFGYYPARRASRLDPIEALRHE